MKVSTLSKGLAFGAALLAFTPGAMADMNAELVIDGVTLITRAPAPEHMNINEIISGWVYRSDETQAMQMDDFDNPGMLAVDAAAIAWETAEGDAGKSCASCHNDAASMAGLRTEMPRYNEAAGDLWSLEEYINDCRTERMGAEAWGWNSTDMINMTALISIQSRGMPMNVAIDGPAAPFWEQGREMYYTRFGQLELACANCHEDNYGNMIRADHLSQGQTNGFPVYRLKTTSLNSQHNRFRGCIRDTRAETFAIGSPEFKALELYVASRGNGLSVEGPSVRN
ncbi:MAG: sulfur oxidation c-type cytochrome SoxA [Paracoccaceae bacterium]